MSSRPAAKKWHGEGAIHPPLESRGFLALFCKSREGGVRSTIGFTALEHDLLKDAPAYSWVTSFQCPSEMTSTTPSTTLTAV